MSLFHGVVRPSVRLSSVRHQMSTFYSKDFFLRIIGLNLTTAFQVLGNKHVKYIYMYDMESSSLTNETMHSEMAPCYIC